VEVLFPEIDAVEPQEGTESGQAAFFGDRAGLVDRRVPDAVGIARQT